jgi:hypothetical protein
MSTPTFELPGHVPMTRHKHGDPFAILKIKLTGHDLFGLQQLPQETAIQSEAYDQVRESVLLAEALRHAVADAKEER